MAKRIEDYPHLVQLVDPNSHMCQHAVTRLGREEKCWRTLRVGLWGGVPLCPAHRKQLQAWLDEACAGTSAEVWAWLGENGRQLPMRRATRIVPEGYVIFLSGGKVGYEALHLGVYLNVPMYYLEGPILNSRRNTDGRWIDSDARLIVKRVD